MEATELALVDVRDLTGHVVFGRRRCHVFYIRAVPWLVVGLWLATLPPE